MRQALAIAQGRRGFCAPNPAVGAVVVKEGQLLASGQHWACGHPHAEVDALQQIAGQAAGATLYISLEPCCHWGKTPPCTDLIIQQGLARVVYGGLDPNPQVAGRSQQILSTAGISCEQLSLPEIEQFYASYYHWRNTGRPYVTVKLALSLDGKIAGPGGQPVAISGPELKLFTHQQRRLADAILTTVKTIQQDNPQLNVRLPTETYRKPVYILDSQLSIPPDAQIFSTASRVTLFHGPAAPAEKLLSLQRRGVHCIEVTSSLSSQLNLIEVMDQIGKEGSHDLWVEAGGECCLNLIKLQLVQRGLFYLAPKVLGTGAQSAFAEGIDLGSALQRIDWRTVGQDGLCEMIFGY